MFLPIYLSIDLSICLSIYLSTYLSIYLPVVVFYVLRATTACTFSSLIWPAGSAPAAVASVLFDPPEPRIIGKTQCFATDLFGHLDLLPSQTFSSLIFSLLLFSLLLFFSSVHIVGSLTFPPALKFPDRTARLPSSSPGGRLPPPWCLSSRHDFLGTSKPPSTALTEAREDVACIRVY